MNILAVDTAGKTAGVALLQDDRLLYEVYLDAGMTHSETLMPMIDTCLKTCGMTCADIDLYGVNAGPGSFTGLRIGLAAVKGLAFPRETLCAPVSTLEALAAAHTGEGTVLCALDARRAQVYSAAFDLATHQRLLEDDARSVADLAQFVENCKKPLFFVGDGLTLCDLTHQTVAGLGKADHRRGGACTLRVCDNNGLAALHDSHAAVGSTKVDTNDLTHNENSSRKNKSYCLCDAQMLLSGCYIQNPCGFLHCYSATTTVAWRTILSPSL